MKNVDAIRRLTASKHSSAFVSQSIVVAATGHPSRSGLAAKRIEPNWLVNFNLD